MPHLAPLIPSPAGGPAQREPPAPYPPDGKAVASLVLGILGLVGFVLMPPLGLACALVGLVLGLLSRRERREGNGLARAGWICSLVALAIPLALVTVGVVLLAVGS